MSLNISEERRLRALQPPEQTDSDQRRPHWMMRGVALTASATALGGIACLAAAFALREWRTALAGSTLLIIAAIAGAVLVLNQLLADRNEFYRRGQLDGWYRHYRGLPPEVDDPLWRSAS